MKKTILLLTSLFLIMFLKAQNTNYGTDAGNSGDANTSLGYMAGNIVTGNSNTFVGNKAGINNTTGGYNIFLGSYAGFTNTTGKNNNFLGFQAGLFNTTGNDNNFLGFYAGQTNTTGSNNNFLGNYAGFANTTGSNNTFTGSNSGQLNTTGNYNTFNGFKAGYSNTTGNHNQFFGYNSGLSNTTGSCNNFHGSFSGNANTSGAGNNFFGYAAGNKNTTGTSNNFYGHASGYFNTTGTSNSFYGHYSGYSNTTGNNNNALGNGAGYNCTTGSSNIYIGFHSGFKNTTGSNNTFIGDNSGAENYEGNSNVFLGSNAGYSETGSNKLYIDNSNTETPLIYGDFSTDFVNINGKLGIGMSTAPTEQLEVEGNIKATKFIGEGASQWTTNGSNIYYNTGSVGIGTDAPSNTQGWNRVLDVRGDLASKILTSTANADVKTGMYAHTSWHGGGGFIGTESSHPLYLIAGYDPKMTILTNGNVLIKEKLVISKTRTNSNYQLDVDGTIRANEVKINADGRDIVFAPTYKLRPLAEVESFIKQNQHLPEIAPAKDMQNNGVNISELQMQLLQKVEELTLYLIEQQKQIKELKLENEKLKKEVGLN